MIEGEEIYLRLYLDCCFSGKWVRLLEQQKIYSERKVYIICWSACGEYESATETVFSGLLKNQIPNSGCGGFDSLWENKNREVAKGQTLKVWAGFLPTFK